MRADYCPLSKEPCQSLCDMPCNPNLTVKLMASLGSVIDALDRNTSPFPLSIEETFAVLDTAKAALSDATFAHYKSLPINE